MNSKDLINKKIKVGDYEVTERASYVGFVPGEITWRDGTPLTEKEYAAATAGCKSRRPASESPEEVRSSGAE